MEKKENQYIDLGKLVGGFAHEIKNPLSTIALNLKLLSEELKNIEGPQERLLGRVKLLQEEVKRLELILDQFLRIARPPKLEKHPADLNRVLREISVFVEPELKRRGIDLRLYCDESLPLVPMDANLIRQALLNLVLNAQHALEKKDRGPKEIILSSKEKEGKAAITVIDSGIGMKPEVLSKCFKPWYSTKPGGSGLGLPLTKRIIQNHGGTINIQSELGKGTHIEILLPLEGKFIEEEK